MNVWRRIVFLLLVLVSEAAEEELEVKTLWPHKAKYRMWMRKIVFANSASSPLPLVHSSGRFSFELFAGYLYIVHCIFATWLSCGEGWWAPQHGLYMAAYGPRTNKRIARIGSRYEVPVQLQKEVKALKAI